MDSLDSLVGVGALALGAGVVLKVTEKALGPGTVRKGGIVPSKSSRLQKRPARLKVQPRYRKTSLSRGRRLPSLSEPLDLTRL